MRIVIVALLVAGAPGIFAAQQDRSLPLFFFPNTGQAGASVRYIAQTPDLAAQFLDGSAVFQAGGHRLSVRFAGAEPGVSIEARERLEGNANFFLGTSGWKTDVPTYGRIVYKGVYPGIDMSYGGTGRHVKSEFLVSPGANPGLIRMEYSEPVAIDSKGNLTAGGFVEQAPQVYQKNEPIAGRYRLLDAHTVGFEIGAYDSGAPLLIDPTISYSTYLGGSGLTAITGVAVDSSSNLYVTGWTEALNFPVAGAYQATNQGSVNVVVAKLNSAGSALLYATYIGGKSTDKGAAIAVDSSGEAYVTGSTSSSNFPLVLSNRSTIGGSTTAFVLKLNAAGNALLYSGYLGGTSYDTGNAIAVDSGGHAYIAGDTQSANFPNQNSLQGPIGGGTDAFVTVFSPAGVIQFSTFLGGSGNEHAGGIAVDALGDVFVGGSTTSANFPTTVPLQSALKGTQDAFLTKITYAGVVGFSTYFGGSGGSPQQINAVALDSAGNAYVTGVTTSTDFPVTTGAFQNAIGGPQNAFAAKITAAGTLAYSTFLGGAAYDWGSGIAVSAAGNAYVGGYTASQDFPVANAAQTAFGGLYDAFISEFNSAGNGLIFSTFYGGAGSDTANAIALDASANIYVGGQTGSSNFPLTNAYQSTLAASSTGWVARIGVSAVPPTTPAVVSVSPTSGSGSTVTFTAKYSDSGGGSTLTSAALLVNSTASPAYGCYVSYNPGLNVFSLYNDAGTAVLSTVTPGGQAAQNDECALNGVGSSATVSGTSLTVTFAITFQTPFTGSQSVYLSAADASSNTGLQVEGAYTVTIAPGTPQISSVSPNAGSGTGATFTFVYSDTVYANNLTSAAFLFNTSVSFSNACYVVYNIAASTVTLTANNGTSTTSVALGSSTALQNSQCTVTNTSATQSGLSIVFSASVYFKGAFNGTQNIYMYAAVGSLNTGWVAEGTFAASNGGQPQVVSVVPNSGTGPAERFTFTIADPGGASYLNYAAIVFAPTTAPVPANPQPASSANSGLCILEWDGNAGTLALTYNNPALGAEPCPFGGASGCQTPIAINSQCTLNFANSTVVRGATQVLITLDLTFNSAFSGPKYVYMYAGESGANTGSFATVGSPAATWTVTGGTPTDVNASVIGYTSGAPVGACLGGEVVPCPSLSTNLGIIGSTYYNQNVCAPGKGSCEATFVFTTSDSNSQSNITGVNLLFTTGTPANLASSCFVHYDRTITYLGAVAIGLLVNSPTGSPPYDFVLTPSNFVLDPSNNNEPYKFVGYSDFLANTQCRVEWSSLPIVNGNLLAIAQILFYSPFTATKSVYVQVLEPGENNPWVYLGTWTG
jgi:hypothetical protein